MSLIERAHRLEKLAKTASAGQGDRQDVERLRTALQKLRTAFPSLRDSLASRRAVDGLGATAGVSLTFREAQSELAKYVAARGLPTWQKIGSASTSMQQQLAQVSADTTERWGSWATAQIATLPKVKIAALPAGDRQRVEDNFKLLELDARKSPSPALVNGFRARLRLIRDDLGEVSVEGPILDVLERFSGVQGLRLSDVSNEEIAVLRSNPEIAAQFVLRRQA